MKKMETYTIPVLIPNNEIVRTSVIYKFSEETIEKLFNEYSFESDDRVINSFIIKEDFEDYPKGTWMVTTLNNFISITIQQ